MYSNAYIFRYAAILVITVAAILSTTAMFLKPMQDKNIAIEKMKGILLSANIEADATTAVGLFDEYIKQEVVINKAGEIVGIYENGEFAQGEIRAFDIDMKKELYNKSKEQDFNIPMYVCEKDGQTIYILPLLGSGLWGPIWGNLAVKDDFNEIIGATFAHAGETPGLGAEIDTEPFMDQFVGKQLFKGDEFQSIVVQKGGIRTLPTDMQIHGVDAISGGTITSNGVTDMLQNCVENYVPYIKKQK